MVKALLDSGTVGMFMNKRTAAKNGFKLQKLERPIAVRNVDGTNCHKLHLVISPPFLRRFPRSQSQLKALKKTFRSVPVTSRGTQ